MIGATFNSPQNLSRHLPFNFDAEVLEHYRSLLRRLGWPNTEHPAMVQTLGITCCHGGDGVSTVAAQLAATAASMGSQRVLLVDAHLARPSVARMFGGTSATGFADAVLAGNAEETRIQASPVAHLSILAAGSAKGTADQVYDSPALAGFVTDLKSDFDLIVFDLPPAGASHAPLRLAELLDGVLLVVASEAVHRQDARRLCDSLAQSRVRMLGAVLNQRRHYLPAWWDRWFKRLV